MPTLIQFVTIVKTNKARLKRMYRFLEELERRCDSIPGPRISDEPRGSSGGNTMVQAILKKLDYEEKIKWYESMDELYTKWIQILTPRELTVFDSIYMKDMTIEATSEQLKVTYQLVYQYKQKLEKKWSGMQLKQDT